MGKKGEDLKPIDWYAKMPDKFKGGSTINKYKNYDKLHIEVPFRGLICGAPGSKKTNTLLTIITTINAWDHIIVFAKVPNQPLYNFLKESMETVAKNTNNKLDDVFMITDDVSKIPTDVTQIPTKTLIVIDDMQTENAATLRKISNLFCNSRSTGKSCIYIAQGYYATPKQIRQCSDYIFFKRHASAKDLKLIMKEYVSGEEEEDEFKEYYDDVLKDPNNWVLIDTISTQPERRIRLNFGV